MSNTIKALIAIVSIILIASAGVFILGKNRVPESSNTAVQSSITELSSLKLQEKISPSSEQNPSIAKNNSSLSDTEIVQTVSQVIDSNCNNLDPINIKIIKNNNNCFGLFNWDEESLNDFEEKSKIINLNELIAIDYYKKIQNEYISKFNQVNIIFYKIVNKDKVEVVLSMQDKELLLKNNPKMSEIGGPLNLKKATYSITKNSTNGNWTFNFVQFEN